MTRPLRAQAVLSKGDGGGPDVATRYYERALPEFKAIPFTLYSRISIVWVLYGNLIDKRVDYVEKRLASIRAGEAPDESRTDIASPTSFWACTACSIPQTPRLKPRARPTQAIQSKPPKINWLSTWTAPVFADARPYGKHNTGSKLSAPAGLRECTATRHKEPATMLGTLKFKIY